MSLDKVVQEILRKGEERKLEIIRQGEKERDEQVALVDKQIEQDRMRLEKRAQSSLAQMEQQELSSAELESKRTLLAAQRHVLEDLRAQVLSSLATYPADQRKRLYAKLLAKAKDQLGECYVYSNAADRPLLKLPAQMSEGGTVDCVGGLVFESKDRSVRLDFRFESMLDDVWNRNMQEIYSRFFR